jgi:acyl carrier protein phosphodiesterase
MNYLAHFHLAARADSSLTGNYLGDAVKGTMLDAWPPAIARGIRLHRGIDAFTDHHPDVLRTLALIEPPRRRFAGIILDMAFDHFLACHWSSFHGEPLPVFTRQVYETLAQDAPLMPQAALERFERMREYDWLQSYQRIEVIGRALDAIAARLSRRTALYGAVQDIERHYDALEATFLCFYPQLLHWVQHRGEIDRPRG